MKIGSGVLSVWRIVYCCLEFYNKSTFFFPVII